MSSRFACAFSLFCAVVATGCSEKITWEVPPTRFSEIDFELPNGATCEARFTARGGTMHWNIHTHPDEEVVVHEEGRTTEGIVRWTAREAGPVSFLWANEHPSEPMQLEVSVRRTGGATMKRIIPSIRSAQ